MRLTLTALGRTLLDVRLLEDDENDEDPGTRDAWPLDSQALVTESHRIGYIDDPGRDTQPWG